MSERANDLRQAAHMIILDGEEASKSVERLVGFGWRKLLLDTFAAHRTELMALCTQYPPPPAAELQLLELCRQASTSSPAHVAFIEEAAGLYG